MSRFNIALLGEQEVPGAEIAPEAADAVLDEIVESPEGDLAAADEIAAEMDEASGAIDEAADTAETLENVGDVLETAEGEGGIDPIAAEAIKVCVEHMRTRMGMQSAKPLIALEGFKSKTTRVQALRIAKEDIKETAKQIWQAIVNAFNKAIAWVKDFFNKLFDGATKLKVRAEKVKKIAEGKKGQKAEEKKIDNGSVAEVLRLHDKVIPPAGVLEALKELPNLIMGKKAAVEMAELQAMQVEQVLAAAEDTERFDKLLVNMREESIRSTTQKEYQTGQKDADMVTYVVTDDLPGDKVVVATTSRSDDVESIKKSIGKEKVQLIDKENRKSLMNTEMEVLTVEQTIEICKNVISVAEVLIKSKGSVDKLQQGQKKIQDRAKKLVSNMKDDAQKNARFAANAARLAMNMQAGFVPKVNQYVVTFANAALTYSTASLAEYGKEKKKEE